VVAEEVLEARGRTALVRLALSRPMQRALDDGVIRAGETSVFDFGCGRGGDVERLTAVGVCAGGWDPWHRRTATKDRADIVNLGFVLNVIETPTERATVLREAWSLTRRVLVVAVRTVAERDDVTGDSEGDGVRTSTGTFQKLYEQDELRVAVQNVLGVRPLAAAPGVVFVFREPQDEQRWLAGRVRSAVRIGIGKHLLDRHTDLVAALVEFYKDHGRLPRPGEVPFEPEIREAFGSMRAAFAVLRRSTGDERWDRVRDQRSQDLLVYLALSRFDRRPKPKDLPDALRLDIRDLFGSHKAACEVADRLLFAIAEPSRVRAAAERSPVGKRLPSAIYVHADAVDELPPLLRVLEGAARTLVGATDQSTIVKLHLDAPTVSYLEYPDFDRDPHPALRSGWIVKLDRLSTAYRDYTGHRNPPILHRKELFLAAGDVRRPLFARLSKQEQRAGLYDQPSLIGTRSGWQKALSGAAVEARGHRLFKRRPSA
jgi:DNA phosphorothioation-associated putative methyltransferase